MEYNKGLIRRASEVEAKSSIEGHPKMRVYRLLDTVQTETMPKEEGSLYLTVALDEIQPDGGVDPHYHVDAPEFDHVFYVISGRILGRVGDKEEEVGPDGIIYCPSGLTHSIKNISSETAKVLAIVAFAPGETPGRSIFVK